jgi:thiol-disulfide isomerase/thioredoxin
MKKFLKKKWGDILFLVVILLLIVPQTRMPIQIFVQRLISFSPSEIAEKDRNVLNDYEWRLGDSNGDLVNFSSSKGNVIVINFWATWCPPCRAEMPSLQALYTKYKEDVDFYFVTQEDRGLVDTFLKKYNYDLPVFFEMQNSPDLLNAQSLPTTFLISKDGEIVIRKTGVANWNSDAMHTLLERLTR